MFVRFVSVVSEVYLRSVEIHIDDNEVWLSLLVDIGMEWVEPRLNLFCMHVLKKQKLTRT